LILSGLGEIVRLLPLVATVCHLVLGFAEKYLFAGADQNWRDREGVWAASRFISAYYAIYRKFLGLPEDEGMNKD
jgi:hypothetical protein